MAAPTEMGRVVLTEGVGPNAALIADDLETEVRKLKAELDREIQVGGPVLARSLGDLGLLDEYRIYLHPAVTGGGSPYFVGPRPPLRFVDSERIDENVIRLTYVLA
jgi:riboflavin biosynthesis pyrimidine reductase